MVKTFFGYNKDDILTTYEVICIFKLNETNRRYVIYKEADSDTSTTYASVIFNGRMSSFPFLLPIETEKEWEAVDFMLNKHSETLKAAS